MSTTMAIALSSSSGSDGNNLPGTSSLATTTTPSTATATTTVAVAVAATTLATGNSSINEGAAADGLVSSGGGGGPTAAATTVPANKSPSSSSACAQSIKVAHEMVGGCAVCLDENGSECNPLVYCDGCEIAVHQACYGIVTIPSGSWYCCRCDSGRTKNQIRCKLCPVEDGALKKTESGDWAHVLCALYIPEVTFGNTNTMEPIILTEIIPDRYSRICYICEEAGRAAAATYGAKINCQHLGGKCKRCFHVTCAQAAGLLREEQSRNSETLNYLGYCKDHFRKLKAPISNSKKRDSNPNSSSMLDSASDSSQDNDSRRNNAIEQDKNTSNRTKVLPTTNMSQLELTAATIPTNISQSTPTLTASKSATPLVNSSPSGLTVPLISISGNGSKSNSIASPSPKKKRTTKSTQGQNSTIEQQQQQLNVDNLVYQQMRALSKRPDNTTPANSQDVYDWPSSVKESEKPNSTSTPSKPNKKKPATMQATNYTPAKVGSPNLSISSTSPSSASPSSSTKSTSNSSSSSTTVTATAASSSSSSSSTTSSSSPTPALLSPSMSNRGSTTRQESPLASNSKTNSNMGNKLAPEPALQANHVSPALNQLISTRINLDNLRPDLRKSLPASTSLLSTTVPMSTIDTPMQLSIGPAGDASLPPRTAAIEGHARETNATTSTPTSKPDTAQPTIPPLTIAVPPGSATTFPTKPTPKARAPARNTKKKAAEASANTPATSKPKPEPKPNQSRSKKAAGTENGAAATPKAEPKARKGKANTKTTEAIASSSNANQNDAAPTTPATSGPTKRKSRTASAESNPSTAPAPAKRIRKKKTDTPAPPNESKSTTQTALSLPAPQSSINHLAGPGPLMINTPAQNNPLPPGFNPADGNKYFAPALSPYTNYDSQMAASSLSRSSLSRLFTSSSSAANTNSTNQTLDDPAKAFDDLRDYSWSQLSRCVLEQAQQFDIPQLIGTLHTLRSENEKLQNRVRDLTLKREQLSAMNARLDLPPQLLTQNLTNSNPNYSNIVSSLTNSPKGLPLPSPGSALSKQPLVIASSYNHMGSGHLGPAGFMDRSSPLVAQTHSTLNNIKSSSISTPSPPIAAIMAAHNNSNRAGLTVNQPPYMPNSYPQMNATGQINSTSQGSSFYARQ